MLGSKSEPIKEGGMGWMLGKEAPFKSKVPQKYKILLKEFEIIHANMSSEFLLQQKNNNEKTNRITHYFRKSFSTSLVFEWVKRTERNSDIRISLEMFN